MITVRELEATLVTALPEWLARQRWFGGKGRTLTGVALADVAWLDGDAREEALAVIAVTYTAAASEHYALWLSLAGTPDARGAIGPLHDAAGRWVVDAAADTRAERALWRTLGRVHDLPTEHGGLLRVADLSATASAAFAGVPAIRPLAIEQSNTSIRVGDHLVFKLVRRLQPGENPELEICRFLSTRTRFTAVPSLHGSVTYVAPRGDATTLAIVQGWIPNDGDGWHQVLARIGGELSEPGSWTTMGAEIGGLGGITAAFHQASASDPSSPAFAPTPVTAADAARWTGDVVTRAARVVPALAAAPIDDRQRERLAHVLGRVASHDLAPVPSIEGPGLGFSRIRIHGDYHLGQTLKTTSGFVLIDFEGEPTRSIEARRRAHCALKDVAGMLRSFAYAIAAATQAAPGGAPALTANLDMAGAFLDGYFGAIGASPVVFLPADSMARRGWLRFFLVEKALYELEYELNNRPDWVRIPAQGLLRMLDV